MALAPAEELAFTEDDLGPLTDLLHDLAGAGAGWVNLTPEVEPGAEPPPRRLVVAVFSSRGDAVPMVTWTPPERAGGRSTVGIEHGSGPGALARLADLELLPGAGWLKVADHPRRGLVVTAPGEADPGDVARWMLAAAHALTEVPLTGAWLASVYRT